MLGAGAKSLTATSEVVMLNKPKILTLYNQKFGGVRYYRQIMPSRHLPFSFTHDTSLLDTKEEDVEKLILDLVRQHDLVLIKHFDNPSLIVALLGACSYYHKPLLVDFDDNIFTTDGLAPDKYTYTKENEKLHYVETLLRECTAITVSVPSLVTVYEKYGSVHILPNMVDMADWKLQKRTHDRATIGWAGSVSHIKDHAVLSEVYNGVIRENPDVVFSFMGQTTPEQLKVLPRRNWEIKPASDTWERYPRLLAEAGYDVGLAPLTQSQFNYSRSLAKWFEYTMTGIPTIASEWGPYTELRDGQDALLVQTPKGWVEAINYLLKNKHERTNLITTARQRIADEFSTNILAPRWSEVLHSYIGSGFVRRT